jgi:hypothetical protein
MVASGTALPEQPSDPIRHPGFPVLLVDASAGIQPS